MSHSSYSYKTAAEERAERDAIKAKRSKRYRFEPVGIDVWDPKVSIPAGTVVVKIQPYGCPRNGTMGHTYIGDPETGEFIGLVLLNSLEAT